jgi:hypothetical protein
MKIWPASLIILLFANACQAEGPKPANAEPQESINQPSNSPHVAKYKVVDAKAKNKELADQMAKDNEIEIEPDEPIRTVKFADNTKVVVEPIRIIGRSGDGAYGECAIRIDGGLLVTVGEEGSETEVLLCFGLKEIGALSNAKGIRQIGLIYYVGTRNNDFTNAIVLTEINPGNWAINEAGFGKMDEKEPPKTIPSIARWMNENAKGQ